MRIAAFVIGLGLLFGACSGEDGSAEGTSGGSGSGAGSGTGGSAGDAQSSGGSAQGGSAQGGSAQGGSAQGGTAGSSPDGGAGTGNVSGSAGSGAGGTANTPIHVVVLGASSACGKNLDVTAYGGEAGGLAFTWVNRYRDHLTTTRPGSQVSNLCVPGYNTYHAMPTGTTNPVGMPQVDPAKNITAALALSPDAIIASYPAVNDTSNVAEIVGNLQTIAATASTAGVPIWISTPQPVEAASTTTKSKQLQLRSEILQTFTGHALDFWTPLVGPNDSWDQSKMLTDGVHPNKVGHGLLFDVVVTADIPTATFGS